MNHLNRTLVLLSVVLGSSFAMTGCAVDENPITPQKMEEMRQKEAQERANFNPDMNAPKGEAGGQ